jgi:hypothetical protein
MEYTVLSRENRLDMLRQRIGMHEQAHYALEVQQIEVSALIVDGLTEDEVVVAKEQIVKYEAEMSELARRIKTLTDMIGLMITGELPD